MSGGKLEQPRFPAALGTPRPLTIAGSAPWRGAGYCSPVVRKPPHLPQALEGPVGAALALAQAETPHSGWAPASQNQRILQGKGPWSSAPDAGVGLPQPPRCA